MKGFLYVVDSLRICYLNDLGGQEGLFKEESTMIKIVLVAGNYKASSGVHNPQVSLMHNFLLLSFLIFFPCLNLIRIFFNRVSIIIRVMINGCDLIIGLGLLCWHIIYASPLYGTKVVSGYFLYEIDQSCMFAIFYFFFLG